MLQSVLFQGFLHICFGRLNLGSSSEILLGVILVACFILAALMLLSL